MITYFSMNLTIKKYLKWSYVVILATFGFGMSLILEPVNYYDVSSNPEYSNFVNTEYKTTEDLYIYGIREDGNAAKPLHNYNITNVNFSGPEVLSKDILKNGILLKIKKVEKTTNLIIKWQNLSGVQYVVDIDPPYINNQKPIYIDSDKINTYTTKK